MEQKGIDPLMVGWLEAHADEPIVKRAWLLALGLGTAEDKSDHLQALKEMVRGV